MMIVAWAFVRLISWASRKVSGYELQIELKPKTSKDSEPRCLTRNGKKNSERVRLPVVDTLAGFVASDEFEETDRPG